MLTKEEIISVLPEGDIVHVFTNPSGMLIGADHDKSQIIKKIDQYEFTFAGEQAKALKHGLCFFDGIWNFIETDMDKLDALDRTKNK